MDHTQIIQEKLRKIEIDNDCQILLAVESGSRGWGFESLDSDYDVRFIYSKPVEWYLDVQENLSDSIVEMQDNGLYDFAGWELRKTLRLLQKSNPTLFEKIQSPIIYVANDSFKTEFLSLAKESFKPISTIYHYLSMAKGNFSEYLDKDFVNLKKYLYVFRPVICMMYIEKYDQMPLMLFEDMRRQVDIPANISMQLDRLLELKRNSSEMDNLPQIAEVNAYLKEKIDYFESIANTFKKHSDVSIGDLNNILQKYTLR